MPPDRNDQNSMPRTTESMSVQDVTVERQAPGSGTPTANAAASAIVPASTAGARISRALPSRTAPPMLASARVIPAPNPNTIQRYNRPLAVIHSGVIDGNTQGTDSRPSLR